jgi:hypothetical protein
MDTQKVLVVTDAPGGLDLLNEHLAHGWRLVTASPMGGGGQTEGFAALVVIERAGQAAQAVLEQIAEEAELLDGDGASADLDDPLDALRREDETRER